MNVAMLNVNSIRLDKDNPRLATSLEHFGEAITSEEVAFALDDSGDSGNTAQTLREAIKAHGGLITPIIVNHTTENEYVVIEGNTRVKIFKELLENGTAGDWGAIPAIVHENMSEQMIHETRLQAHLVGPRDWQPYAKAKYLYELSTNDCMTDAQIEDCCGGIANRNVIRKLIDAYTDMEKYYRPLVASDDRFDTRKFSYFNELQNRTRINALQAVGKNKSDFAQWVIDGKVDTAQQGVRDLPKVLQMPKAAEAFLSDPNMTVAGAMKIVSAAEIAPASAEALSSISLHNLMVVLTEKLANFPYSEVKRLKSNPDAREIDDFKNLNDFLDDLLSDILPEE